MDDVLYGALVAVNPRTPQQDVQLPSRDSCEEFSLPRFGLSEGFSNNEHPIGAIPIRPPEALSLCGERTASTALWFAVGWGCGLKGIHDSCQHPNRITEGTVHICGMEITHGHCNTVMSKKTLNGRERHTSLKQT